MAYKLLIIDDETMLTELLSEHFTDRGYITYVANNSEEAMAKLPVRPDLILLDINMPGMDGLEVCRRIRGHISCPVLFLTARIEDMDKVKGFSAGGDDYIVKPFSLMELEARVSAHLRREARHNLETRVRFSGELTIDFAERSLFYREQEIGLAKKEFDIVELLS